MSTISFLHWCLILNWYKLRYVFKKYIENQNILLIVWWYPFKSLSSCIKAIGPSNITRTRVNRGFETASVMHPGLKLPSLSLEWLLWVRSSDFSVGQSVRRSMAGDVFTIVNVTNVDLIDSAKLCIGYFHKTNFWYWLHIICDIVLTLII